VVLDVRISVTSSRLSELDLQELTQSLRTDLSREAGLNVKLAEQTITPGAKGAEIAVGAIVLSFLASGSAVALFNVIKAYFDRDSSIEIELEELDGRRLKINAQNVRQSQVDRTLKQMREFLRGS